MASLWFYTRWQLVPRFFLIGPCDPIRHRAFSTPAANFTGVFKADTFCPLKWQRRMRARRNCSHHTRDCVKAALLVPDVIDPARYFFPEGEPEDQFVLPMVRISESCVATVSTFEEGASARSSWGYREACRPSTRCGLFDWGIFQWVKLEDRCGWEILSESEFELKKSCTLL